MKGRLYLIRSALVAAVASLLFGFDIAVISGTTESLEQFFRLTGGQLGFTVASALLGAILGAAVVSAPADRLGRKRTLMILTVLYFASGIGCAFAWGWYSLLLFRFIGGMAVGGSSVVSPMYIAEISPASLRGRLVALAQFNIVLGILLAYFSNYWLAKALLQPVSEWRWMFGVEAIPAVALFFLLFHIPDSPRWLVKQRRYQEARDVLQLTGEERPEQQLKEITESVSEERTEADEPLLARKYLFPILVAVSIAAFNQLTGIAAVVYYAPRIFKLVGATGDSALLQSAIIGGMNLLFTVVAITVIDRVGRKPLLLIGSVGMSACLWLVSAALYFRFGSAVLLGSLMAYIGFFAFSQGSVIWVYLSEIFPNRVRAKGQALGTFTHWVGSVAVSWSFPVAVKISAPLSFGFFAFAMIIQFFFVQRILPETKGRSLEQIQKDLGIQ